MSKYHIFDGSFRSKEGTLNVHLDLEWVYLAINDRTAPPLNWNLPTHTEFASLVLVFFESTEKSLILPFKKDLPGNSSSS